VVQSAHLDRFVLDRLPPRELLPEFCFDRPEFQYPARVNAAVELIDRTIEAGWGSCTAAIFPGGAWTYDELARAANRAASVLLNDFALQPGARVLLRGANGPMLSALWLAVLKAGAIAVVTMPLLRARELVFILDKARIDLSLCEDTLLADLEAAVTESCQGRVASYSRDGRSNDSEFERLMRDKPDRFQPVETWATDPALLAFSSRRAGDRRCLPVLDSRSRSRRSVPLQCADGIHLWSRRPSRLSVALWGCLCSSAFLFAPPASRLHRGISPERGDDRANGLPRHDARCVATRSCACAVLRVGRRAFAVFDVS
jgi:AMP-binding enzyme